jgi:SAM-dependent methyltransferase
MRKWLEQPLGQYYIKSTKQKINSMISKSFGYHSLIIGEPELATCVVNSPISHHILIHHHEDSQRNIYSFCCARQDRLPIDTESIDIVYLANCLEMYPNPHEILREAYRVLRPEGRIIISGFNPWSIWGGLCWLARIFKIFPWRAKFIAALKLKDWLQLLGFSHLQTHGFFYYLPINQEHILSKMAILENLAGRFKLPFGAAYLLMAYKRVITLTPIVPDWNTKHYLIADNLVETATQKYNVK